MKISFETLLGRLIQKGVQEAKAAPLPDTAPAPTSIRLKPTTKQFVDAQAAALDISPNSVISMILDGVAEMTLDPTSGTLRTMRERFFYLFSTHGIDLPGIVSVMKNHGFTLSALDNSARLLDLLDQKTITYLSEVFHINPSWVSGAKQEVIELGQHVRWYKWVPAAAKKLMEYAEHGLRPHVLFIRRQGANFAEAWRDNDEGNAEREPIGVAIRLHHKTTDGVEFRTYEVWEFERWNYWRCREQIKLLITFCDQARHYISYSGYELPSEDIDLLKFRNVMPITVLEKRLDLGWYPEDYASIRFKVEKEVEEWEIIRKTYEEKKLDALIPGLIGGASEN